METKSKNYKPIFDIKKKVFLDALVDDYSGLSLYFSFNDATEKFKIFFDSYISFRNSDESERFNSLAKMDKNVYFFEAYHSEYIEWITNESQGIRSSENLKHFIFITDNDIIEVLSLHKPKLITLGNKIEIKVITE